MYREVNGLGFIVYSMLSTKISKLANKKQQKKDLSKTLPPSRKPISLTCHSYDFCIAAPWLKLWPMKWKTSSSSERVLHIYLHYACI